MDIHQILDLVGALEGVVDLAPVAGSEFPEIAWGDHFLYYSPDGTIPQSGQPFATIVINDYPGDTLSRLDPAGRWRLNIHVGADEFTRLIGESPRDFRAVVAGPDGGNRDFAEADTILPHPVYGPQCWVAVVNPGQRTSDAAAQLLRDAHAREVRRAQRRASGTDGTSDLAGDDSGM